MKIRVKFLKGDFSVCKLRDLSRIDLSSAFYFLAKTDDELSLVCFSQDAPDNAIIVDDGWKAFRVVGSLDFAMVGILSRLAQLLAARGISIFAVSTYDTDYVLLKADNLEAAREALDAGGYEIL